MGHLFSLPDTLNHELQVANHRCQFGRHQVSFSDHVPWSGLSFSKGPLGSIAARTMRRPTKNDLPVIDDRQTRPSPAPISMDTWQYINGPPSTEYGGGAATRRTGRGEGKLLGL
ncbi:hypothetical protein M407DRAFT_245782, partial [Tulasnella calospora MUT 4182]